MRVLVTGATGFIGSFVANALLDKGYEVRCLVRTTSNLHWIADMDVECYYGSLFDKGSLREGLKEVDYVYHIAGVTKARTEEEFLQGNLEATRNLLNAVLEADLKLKRFLHVSSLAAVGPSPTILAINEDQEPQPLTWYGKSKLAAEELLMEHAKKLPLTIVRPPVVYGPRDKDVLEFFKTVRRGIIPQLQGRDKYASLIFVKDLAEGIITAAESDKSQSRKYFMADPEPYSYDEFARIILDVLGKRGVRIPVPLPLLTGVAALSERFAQLTKSSTILNRQKVIEMEQDFWVCSPARAKKDLNFETSHTLQQGVEETINWYVRHNWL
jgi:nucleoside-diphosphate-sugar epimerase